MDNVLKSRFDSTALVSLFVIFVAILQPFSLYLAAVINFIAFVLIVSVAYMTIIACIDTHGSFEIESSKLPNGSICIEFCFCTILVVLYGLMTLLFYINGWMINVTIGIITAVLYYFIGILMVIFTEVFDE